MQPRAGHIAVGVFDLTDSLPQKTTTITSGTLLGGRYELLQLLGSGGMGSVYKARQTDLGTFVAVKVMRPDAALHLVAVQRLQAEAKSLSVLTHPAIPKVYCIEPMSDGGMFVVMDFIDGVSLEKELQARGKLPAEEAVEIVRQVADALAHAHAQGIIHRDLKPANIMLSRTDGTLRCHVLDFGIAKHLNSTQKFTQTGALIGTVKYMSPEQASGAGVTAQSDIYSLACVAFEMLTGRAPYDGESPMEVLMKHVDSTIPQLSGPLNSAISKALAKQPEDRFTSMREFSEAMLSPETVMVTAKRKKSRRDGQHVRIAMICAAVISLATVAVMGLHHVREESANNEAKKSAEIDLRPKDAHVAARSLIELRKAERWEFDVEPFVALVAAPNENISDQDRITALQAAAAIELHHESTDKAIKTWWLTVPYFQKLHRSPGASASVLARVVDASGHVTQAVELLQEVIAIDAKSGMDKQSEALTARYELASMLTHHPEFADREQVEDLFRKIAADAALQQRFQAKAELRLFDLKLSRSSKEKKSSLPVHKEAEAWIAANASNGVKAQFIPWAELIFAVTFPHKTPAEYDQKLKLLEACYAKLTRAAHSFHDMGDDDDEREMYMLQHRACSSITPIYQNKWKDTKPANIAYLQATIDWFKKAEESASKCDERMEMNRARHQYVPLQLQLEQLVGKPARHD